MSGDGRANEQLTLAEIRELILSTTQTWPAAIPLFHWLWSRPRLTSLLSIGYVVCSPLATSPSSLLWADISATISEFNHVHRSRWYSDNLSVDIIFGQMELSTTSADTQHLWVWWHSGNHFVDIIFSRIQLSQHPPIHSTCEHDDIPVIIPILSMCLSTISAVFTPAGHDNILRRNFLETAAKKVSCYYWLFFL